MYDECTCIFGNHVFWSISSFSLYLRSVFGGINDYLSVLIRLNICGCHCMPCVQPKSNCLKITVNFGFNNCSFAHPLAFCSFFHPLYLLPLYLCASMYIYFQNVYTRFHWEIIVYPIPASFFCAQIFHTQLHGM